MPLKEKIKKLVPETKLEPKTTKHKPKVPIGLKKKNKKNIPKG